MKKQKEEKARAVAKLNSLTGKRPTSPGSAGGFFVELDVPKSIRYPDV
jgi:hypothetical protein